MAGLGTVPPDVLGQSCSRLAPCLCKPRLTGLLPLRRVPARVSLAPPPTRRPSSELIAYHAAVESTVRPPVGLLSLRASCGPPLPTGPSRADAWCAPPTVPRSTVLLNRCTHDALQPSALPHLYASIFRATFDLPALHRRFPKSRLTSPRLALELKRRWTVLKLLRGPPPEAEPAARTSTARPPHEEVLWVVFLMCLENDGRNLYLLRNYGQSARWISAVAGRAFARHSTERGMTFLPARMSIEARAIPRDTVDVALTVWLFWYLKARGDLRNESQLEKERNRTMLRVFVFAAQLVRPPRPLPSRDAHDD